jgi:hypothetical protein
MGGIGDEAEPGQLVLALPLGLVVARGGRIPAIIGVVVEVAKGREEDMLLGPDLLKVLLLEGLLVKSSLWLVLDGGVLALVLVFPESYLLEECLFFLGQWAMKWLGSPHP